MAIQLHNALLFIAIMVTVSGQSQNKDINQIVNLFSHDIMVFDLHENSINLELNRKKVFSYTLIENHDLHNHLEEDEFHNDGSHDISLIDIISSDEGSDFNCSGGFCMDKSHFHKRGLTLKKQLFNYFMKISC
jgi:hypothetical protein